MSKEFKAGDLALIIFSYSSSHVGQCVEVMEVLIDDQAEYLFDGHEHLSEAKGELCAFVDVKGDGAWLYPQRHLMPLRGEFAPEQQKAKEAEPCA